MLQVYHGYEGFLPLIWLHGYHWMEPKPGPVNDNKQPFFGRDFDFITFDEASDISMDEWNSMTFPMKKPTQCDKDHAHIQALEKRITNLENHLIEMLRLWKEQEKFNKKVVERLGE